METNEHADIVGVVAVCAAALAQLVGLGALFVATSHTDVRLNDGQGASCQYVDIPAQAPLEGTETWHFEGSWSWLPPGLRCTTQVDGRTVVVREPSWATMWVPMTVLSAAIGATAAAVAVAVAAGAAARERRWTLPAMLIVVATGTMVAQPLSIVTVLIAFVLRGAI